MFVPTFFPCPLFRSLPELPVPLEKTPLDLRELFIFIWTVCQIFFLLKSLRSVVITTVWRLWPDFSNLFSPKAVRTVDLWGWCVGGCQAWVLLGCGLSDSGLWRGGPPVCTINEVCAELMRGCRSCAWHCISCVYIIFCYEYKKKNADRVHKAELAIDRLSRITFAHLLVINILRVRVVHF